MSELTALSFEDDLFQVYTHKLELKTKATFRAKNQPLHEEATKIVIPSLTKELETDDVTSRELALCPVRALLHYKQITEPKRFKQKAMFVCYQKGKTSTAASANTLSRWVKNTVYHAYSDETRTPDGNIAVNIHQLRSLGNSIAFTHGASMAQVLEAGFWKTPNTFINYYLKDMSYESGSLNKLGQIVAGQRIIS